MCTGIMVYMAHSTYTGHSKSTIHFALMGITAITITLCIVGYLLPIGFTTLMTGLSSTLVLHYKGLGIFVKTVLLVKRGYLPFKGQLYAIGTLFAYGVVLFIWITRILRHTHRPRVNCEYGFSSDPPGLLE